MEHQKRAVWLQFAIFCSILTFVCHLALVLTSGQSPISAPISELSRHRFGAFHTLGLALFGLAHVALAMSLGGLERGWSWAAARVLLVVASVGLIYVAVRFATLPSDEVAARNADIGLWIVASLTGTAMGALQPGLSRIARRLGVFSAFCLGLWLWMVPVFFVVDELWLGAYQRAVGGIYVCWMIGVATGLLREQPHSRAS